MMEVFNLYVPKNKLNIEKFKEIQSQRVNEKKFFSVENYF